MKVKNEKVLTFNNKAYVACALLYYAINSLSFTIYTILDKKIK